MDHATKRDRQLRSAISLPTEPASAGRAHEFVADFLERAGRSDLEEVAKLCVDELVTGLLQRADADSCALEMRKEDGSILVEVTDDSTDDFRLRDKTPLDDGGWGLQLIAAVSDEWGVAHRRDRGQSVWLRLA